MESQIREIVCDAIVEEQFNKTTFFEKHGSYFMITGGAGKGDTLTSEELINQVFQSLEEKLTSDNTTSPKVPTGAPWPCKFSV